MDGVQNPPRRAEGPAQPLEQLVGGADGPKAAPGHLPPPADAIEDHVDVAFSLVPQEAKIRLHVLKDKQQMVERDLNILLDPQTMMLVTGIGARKK